MFENKLAKMIEQQRKRQIAALLAVCGPEEKQSIENRENRGQLPDSVVGVYYGLKGQDTTAQPSGLGGRIHPPCPSPCKGRIKNG